MHIKKQVTGTLCTLVYFPQAFIWVFGVILILFVHVNHEPWALLETMRYRPTVYSLNNVVLHPVISRKHYNNLSLANPWRWLGLHVGNQFSNTQSSQPVTPSQNEYHAKPKILKKWPTFTFACFLACALFVCLTCKGTRGRSPGRSTGPGRWRPLWTGKAHTAAWWNGRRHWWLCETSKQKKTQAIFYFSFLIIHTRLRLSRLIQ